MNNNSIKITLATLFAILLLSSCGNGYDSDDYKKVVSNDNTTIIVDKEIKTDEIVEKDDKLDKFKLVMDEVHAMKKGAMSKVKETYTDLEYTKTVKLKDSYNVAGMGDEDWLYSKEYDVTVIACNELNTPAFIFNGKTLSEVQLKMVKAEMKKMMSEDGVMREDGMNMGEDKLEMMNMGEDKMGKQEIISKGTYGDYSENKVTNGNDKIVIFFHADWCPTCVAAEKDILGKDIPADLTILKANFDKELDLRKKYGVVAQTTFVQIDNKGNLIKKWVGGKLNDIIEKTK